MSSQNMTKYTQIVWGTDWDSPESPVEFDEFKDEIDKLIADGKTDGVRHIISTDIPMTFIRYWTDQAAAEEFASFLTAFAAKYDRKLLGVTIHDALPAGQ